MITKFELYQAAALNGFLAKGIQSDVAIELARDVAKKMVENDLRYNPPSGAKNEKLSDV